MKTDSRGSLVDVERVIRNSGHGRFDMIIQASQRAREIRQQNRNSQRAEHLYGPVTALLEIQSGKIDQDYALKIK
jgi:DNA-directed RNA polymerase subunit K/omega